MTHRHRILLLEIRSYNGLALIHTLFRPDDLPVSSRGVQGLWTLLKVKTKEKSNQMQFGESY